jgi:hypothetical protein
VQGAVARRVFKLVRNAAEAGVELRADRVHDGDDGDRDAGGNQAIFDGGGAGLILEECGKLFHGKAPGFCDND